MFAHYLNFRNYIKGRYDSLILILSLDEYQVRVSTRTKSKEKSKPGPLVTAGSDLRELVVDNSHRRGSRRLPVWYNTIYFIAQRLFCILIFDTTVHIFV